MKRIAVLGGAGLVGTHLCKRLVEAGHDVVCIDVRDIEESPILMPYYRRHELKYINHNIINPFAVECDQIYNLASPSFLQNDGLHPVATLRTNIIGAVNALDLARRNKAVSLYASSSDVYGLSGQQPFSEDEAYTTHVSIYAESKRSAEAMYCAYQKEYGISCRVARLFSIYGSGCQLEDRRVVMSMITAALLNNSIEISGSGEQKRTLCWAGDAACGLEKLMEMTCSGTTAVVNIGSSHEVSVKTLAERIISLTGSRSHIKYVAARLNDPRRIVPDLSRARNMLHWVPETTLDDGLQRTIEYVDALMKNSEIRRQAFI